MLLRPRLAEEDGSKPEPPVAVASSHAKDLDAEMLADGPEEVHTDLNVPSSDLLPEMKSDSCFAFLG
jgi:hypothetical protein